MIIRCLAIAFQISIEGLVSFFDSIRLFQRVSVALESSGQRVRASKSIGSYGIVLRIGRTLGSISNMVIAKDPHQLGSRRGDCSRPCCRIFHGREPIVCNCCAERGNAPQCCF